FIVLSPVGHPLLLFRDLVTAIGIELVRHLQHPNENETTSVPANC
ncbi:MAG: hypothetical protein ACI9C3_003134, partial [Yoonia sp.]